jgi:hypothetical protein
MTYTALKEMGALNEMRKPFERTLQFLLTDVLKFCPIMLVDNDEVYLDHLKFCSILEAKLKLSSSKHIFRTSTIAAYGPLSSFDT